MNLTWNDVIFGEPFIEDLHIVFGENFVFYFHSTVANWWFYKINIIVCYINMLYEMTLKYVITVKN